MQYPMPEVDENMQPPFAIHLAPWAITTAEELHRLFGDNIDLTVGALPYPYGHRPDTGQPAELLNPQDIATELDGPAVVSSGHTLRHALLLRNLTDHQTEIATNGAITAVVIEPQTSEIVAADDHCVSRIPHARPLS